MEMRIIFNDDILMNRQFLSLEKRDIISLLKIVSMFAKNNLNYIDKETLINLNNLDDDFFNKVTDILEVKDGNVYIKDYFTFFKNNKEYVAKSRDKNKGMKEVGEKEEKEDSIDYEKIRVLYNTILKDTNIPQIKILDTKRKKVLKTFFEKAMKTIGDNETNIYDFYEIYFKMINKEPSLTNGWHNSKSNSWFQPGFDYFMREDKFIRIYEKYGV